MAINYPSIHPGQYPYMAREPAKKFETVTPTRKPPILCPTIHPGWYPHYGKEPNTNTLKMAYEDYFNRNNWRNIIFEEVRGEPDTSAFNDEVKRHVNYLQIQRDIKSKVKSKIKAYEDAVEVRRQKLKEIFLHEEREFYKETIDKAFKGEEEKLEEKKKKLELIKKQKEEERQEFVRKKRFDQQINFCQELRPALFKKHLIESKHAQKQQMRENEARRQADKEIDRMWHELTIREEKAKREREEREAMVKKGIQLSVQQTLDMQVRGKELLKAEEMKMKMEDQEELKRHNEELRQKEIDKLKQQRKDKESLLKDIQSQIRVHEEQLRKDKEREAETDRVYNEYNVVELEKEKAERLAKKQQIKKDFDSMKAYINGMKEQKREEEQRLDALVEKYRKEIEMKKEEAECKIILARKEQHENVLKERAEQVSLKKIEAENQLRAQQAENELLQLAFETNMKLQEESDNLHHQAILEYREDLKRQIEYNDELRRREREDLERQLQKGKEEEEKYQKLVAEIIKFQTETPNHKHPFRRVIERYDCHCK